MRQIELVLIENISFWTFPPRLTCSAVTLMATTPTKMFAVDSVKAILIRTVLKAWMMELH